MWNRTSFQIKGTKSSSLGSKAYSTWDPLSSQGNSRKFQPPSGRVAVTPEKSTLRHCIRAISRVDDKQKVSGGGQTTIPLLALSLPFVRNRVSSCSPPADSFFTVQQQRRRRWHELLVPSATLCYRSGRNSPDDFQPTSALIDRRRTRCRALSFIAVTI